MAGPLLQNDFLELIRAEQICGGGTDAFGIFGPTAETVLRRPTGGKHMVGVADPDYGGAPQDIVIHGKAAVFGRGQEIVLETVCRRWHGRDGILAGAACDGLP